MKNDSVRRGSHPGIIGRVDGGQPSTGTTDVTLLWPRSEPASTLSLLGHLVQISVTNNRDNICKTSRETEHSQLINRSSTVLPRQYVQCSMLLCSPKITKPELWDVTFACCCPKISKALLLFVKFLCGRWVLQKVFVS